MGNELVKDTGHRALGQRHDLGFGQRCRRWRCLEDKVQFPRAVHEVKAGDIVIDRNYLSVCVWITFENTKPPITSQIR